MARGRVGTGTRWGLGERRHRPSADVIGTVEGDRSWLIEVTIKTTPTGGLVSMAMLCATESR